MPEDRAQTGEAAKRRTERIVLKIPIRVLCFGGSAGDFAEDSYTILINRDGGLIALEHPVAPNDTLRIINLENLREADFRVVVTAGPEGGEAAGWGVESLEKGRTLWDIDFPPPLDKSGNAGALLECQGCGKQSLLELSLAEVKMLDSAGKLEKLCNLCAELSPFVYADLERRRKEVPGSPQTSAPEPEKWDGKSERRLNKRVGLKLPVLVRNQKGSQEIVKTEDMSKGGMRVFLAMDLRVGERVTVVCPYSSGAQSIEQKAQVRRRVEIYAGRWLYGLAYIP